MPQKERRHFCEFSWLVPHGQDLASLLTAHITSLTVLMIAFHLTCVSFLGEPIQCLCPIKRRGFQAAREAMCSYAKSYCWTHKQYFVDYSKPLLMDAKTRYDTAERELEFYPLVPFILASLALLLKLPNVLWNAFMGEEGLNIPKAVRMGREQVVDVTQTGRAVAFDVSFRLGKGRLLHNRKMKSLFAGRLRSVRQVLASLGLFPLGSGIGAYQTGLFMITRLLTVCVCVAAFPLLGRALGTDYVTWGWNMARWLVTGDEDFWDSSVFPLETMCDFRVREMQNVLKYTVQCVLPINKVSEKVFVALWFWLGVLVLVNLHSYLYWFRKLVFPSSHRRLLNKHMHLLWEDAGERPRELVEYFAVHHLTPDSVLVLKMLEVCVGFQFANLVVKYLWKDFKKEFEQFGKLPKRHSAQPEKGVEESVDFLSSKVALD